MTNQNQSSVRKLPPEITQYFNDCNSLDDPFEFDGHFSIIRSYVNVSDFNDAINENCFSIIHLNIASLNRYLKDLSNFVASLLHSVKVIGVIVHKLKYGNYLHGTLEGYNFEFSPITGTHGGV